MTKILITGATGNVGVELIRSLFKLDHQLEIYAGIRNTETGKEKLAGYKIKFVEFDFLNINTFKPALKNCDLLFLLRPPEITEVEKYFKPLVATARQSGIRHIVFISVQGVEKNKIIPHHRIEKLIIESDIPYTFLRPAYFMQNFLTTLRSDLINKKRIFLPAGNARFTMVDICDIGAVAAQVILNPAVYANKSFELTCDEKLSFDEMAKKLSKRLGINIAYKSPNLLDFYLTKRKEKYSSIYIFVMIMLHYFPRFQKEPTITNSIEKIISRPAKSFDKFIDDNKSFLK